MLGREQLRHRAAVVVADHVCTRDLKRVQEADGHRRLRAERPVRVLWCLGVTEPEEIGREAAMRGRQPGDHLSPDERGEGAAVE
jgi:hypothetical protein